MAVAYQAQGSDVASVTTTLALVAPATVNDDIIIANIYSFDNNVVTLPQGWTLIKAANNTAAQRQTAAWKRAAVGDSAATFNFGVAGTTLAYGILTTYRGVEIVGVPIGTSGTSPNALADAVAYPSITPRDNRSLIVALGVYGLNATTAGAMSGTDPSFTNRVDLETATGTTASLFVFDGLSVTGGPVGIQSHTTTSTVDALNSGILFELLAPELEEAGDNLGGALATKFPALGLRSNRSVVGVGRTRLR